MTEMVHLWPDPLRPASNEDPDSKNIGTLKIGFHVNFSPWKVVQDYSDKSTLGFISVGTLSIIFIAIFGTSIVNILLGKPIFISCHSF